MTLRLALGDLGVEARFLDPGAGGQLLARRQLHARFQILVPDDHENLPVVDAIPLAHRELRHLSADSGGEP